MSGINVLNKEEILVGNNDNLILFIITIILAIILFCVAFNCNSYVASSICFSAALICLVASMINVRIYCNQTVPTGRYRYEVTIDESTPMKVVYDNYNVIEQRGEIWVLEDKEK